MDLTSRLDAEHLAVYRAMPDDLLAGLADDLPATRDRAAALAAAVARPPRPAGLTTEDRYAPGPAGAPDVLVRLYRPEGLPSPAAALYWVHGGGMVMGSIAMNDDMCAAVADHLKILVASVEYRLAPEYPYPAPLEDCYAGLKWFAGISGELGVDAARIAIGGASAGGGLAAGLGLLARDRAEVAIAFQLLVYPMIDDRNITPSSHTIVDPKVWNRAANTVGWNAYLAGAPVPTTSSPTRRRRGPRIWPACRRRTSTSATSTSSSTRTSPTPRRSCAPGCRWSCTSTPAPSTARTTSSRRAALSRRWNAEERAALARGLGVS